MMIALAVLTGILILLQLQPAIIHARRGVAGSFGFRPVTHDCIGWIGSADRVSWMPYADFEFHLGWFHYRYSYTQDDLAYGVKMCMGQDIWFGD